MHGNFHERWWKWTYFHGSYCIGSFSCKHVDLSTVDASKSFHCLHLVYRSRMYSREAPMSFNMPLHTSTLLLEYTKIQLLPQEFDGVPPTRVRFTSMDIYTYLLYSYVLRGSIFSSVQVFLLPWKLPLEVGGKIFPWKLVEVNAFPLEFVKAPMDVHASFYFRCKRKLPLLLSTAASTDICRGSLDYLPYPPTHLYLLPRVSHCCTCFHRTIIKIHRLLLPFDLHPWTHPPNSLRNFIEVNMLPSKLPWKSLGKCLIAWKYPRKLMEEPLFPCKLVEVPWIYMDVTSIACGFPGNYSVDASLSFHSPHSTYTYLPEYPMFPAASTRLTPTQTLTLFLN